MPTLSSFTKVALSGLLFGTMLGVGCQDDSAATSDIDSACNQYCDRRAECDDEVDMDDCLGRCFNNLNECDADDVDSAVAEVRSCSEQTCDDVLECTVLDVLECRF